MKRSRFSESQIVSILKEAEAGVALDELSRQHGFPGLSGQDRQQSDLLQVEGAIRRRGCGSAEAPEGTGGREPEAEADVCRPEPGIQGSQGRG
jgi:hypothetical protein